ncbi:MAG: hypothetical protein ACFFBK_09755, partial [Promethearchaeota archaeon]
MTKKNLEKKVFFGGSIITMNENQPIINAVGIEGEKIVVTGDLEIVKKKMGENHILIDLKGNA